MQVIQIRRGQIQAIGHTLRDRNIKDVLCEIDADLKPQGSAVTTESIAKFYRSPLREALAMVLRLKLSEYMREQEGRLIPTDSGQNIIDSRKPRVSRRVVPDRDVPALAGTWSLTSGQKIISERRIAVLRAIKSMPECSMVDIQAATGLSPSSVYSAANTLAAKGLIDRQKVDVVGSSPSFRQSITPEGIAAIAALPAPMMEAAE